MEAAVRSKSAGVNSGARPARGRPSEGARDALLEAALAAFVERDYEQVSTEDILRRANVSRGAFYHHFPTKLDLFRAVYRASEQRVLEHLSAAAWTTGGPFEQLRAGCLAYLRETERNEELRRIGLGQSRAVLGWEGWREIASELGLAIMRAGVQAAVEAGEMKKHDVETTAQILLGALIDGAMLIVLAEDRSAARGRGEAVIIDLLEGLRT